MWQNQKLNVKQNQFLSRKNQLSSTVSLLCILFEDLGYAIELHEEFADNVTEQCSFYLRKYLFNGQEEKEMTVTIFFLDMVLSMISIVLTKNI